jgi:protease-4
MKNKAFLFGCIVFPLILVIGFFVGFISSFKEGGSPSPKKVPSEAWLLLNPSAMIPDYNEMQPVRWFGSGMISAEEMVSKIMSAATDSRIKGMFIEPSYIQTNYPALTEIGKAINEFKKSGKPVVAYGDMFSQADYLLASYADQIFMEPSASAGLILEGVSANLMFYKELFDKLGIKMQIMQSGEYKGAGEPYSQTSLSPGTKSNIDAVLKDRYSLLLRGLAERRKLSTEDISRIFEDRSDYFISAKTANDMKLIDFPMGRDSTLARLELNNDRLISIADYSGSKPKAQKDKIAVVYLNGQIAPGSSSDLTGQSGINAEKVRKTIELITKDKSIKATILRINSPGGSALESEKIYQQLQQLRQSMPVVVSMGGVAASGGYYISCASDYIVADEATITGSIGVIMMLPETEGLGKKIGISSQTLKHGKFAGAFNVFESFDPALIESLKRSSTATYDEFKARVISARNYQPSSIDSVAEGRVFSAKAAKQNRLIDEIGTLDTAIAKACVLAGISDYSTESYPAKTSWLEALKNSDMLKVRNAILKSKDPGAILEDQLRQLPTTGEWHYLMPYKLD